MNKEKFIEWVKENLSDNVEIFITDKKDRYDAIDIKIFNKHHDNKFYNWYFGI